MLNGKWWRSISFECAIIQENGWSGSTYQSYCFMTSILIFLLSGSAAFCLLMAIQIVMTAHVNTHT